MNSLNTMHLNNNMKYNICEQNNVAFYRFESKQNVICVYIIIFVIAFLSPNESLSN